MGRLLSLLTCLSLFMAAVSVAAQTPQSRLGRLESDTSVICSAVAVTPQIILTAAHCVFGNAGTTPLRAYRLKFFPMDQTGAASQDGPVFGRQLVFDRDYRQSPIASETAIANDLALVLLERELDLPEQRAEIVPLNTGDIAQALVPAEDGQGVATRACPVVVRNSAIVVAECDLPSGGSGAPLLVQGEAGWRLGAIVSSVGERQGRPVVLGVDLQSSLKPLLDELEHLAMKSLRDESSRKTVSEQLGRKDDGEPGAVLPQVLVD